MTRMTPDVNLWLSHRDAHTCIHTYKDTHGYIYVQTWIHICTPTTYMHMHSQRFNLLSLTNLKAGSKDTHYKVLVLLESKIMNKRGKT